ncbi:response regulator [Rickettsiella endosymbiont of Dermanyssus gallinae]|uniref:response regulator n=1 Tax=Rickettsiella endosymbiont of Dermanyssus gallinae TaxID=2856608 RepID=UPI001C52E6D2|nr:response regulator [Rickettsiella endosymbiont of Dermanyssus gallinae]
MSSNKDDRVKIKIALMAENKSSKCSILESYLESLNYKVDIAADGFTAIQKIHMKYYDLIITDYSLPYIPGNEVLIESRLSKINRNTRTILTISHIHDSEIGDYLDLGAHAVLIKPYSIHDLKLAIG